jgi:hypothetical protein
MSAPIPSPQEMFDKAWNGLKNQGWKQAITDWGSCSYLTGCLRCSWGHVDPEGTTFKSGTNIIARSGTVETLRRDGLGIAARLNYEQLQFALELQMAHDTARSSIIDSNNSLEAKMRKFAKEKNLSIPEDVLM